MRPLNIVLCTMLGAFGLIASVFTVQPVPTSMAQPTPQAQPVVSTTSADGVAFLIREEGDCRLTAYADSGGTWTIGIGHAGPVHGHEVIKSMHISKATCLALLHQDLGVCEKEVSEDDPVGTTQWQFDAFVSLCFNVGPAAFKQANVTQGFSDYSIAWNMLKLNHVKGKPYVLLTRRFKEATLYLDATYSEPTPAVKGEL